MEQVISWLGSHGTELLVAASAIVGAAATIARFTPNTSDDRIIQTILDLINFLGMNHGKAKNDPSAK